MKNIALGFMYVLVVICGVIAISEVVSGGGRIFPMVCILAALALITYIIKLPVTYTSR